MSQEFRDRPAGAGQAQQAKGEVEQAGRAVGEAAAGRSRRYLDEQKSYAADRIDRIASAMHTTASQMKEKDPDAAESMAPRIDRIAERMEQAARRLREESADSLFDEAQSLARREPALFLTATVGAGFAIGRFLRSSSARRRAESSGAASSPPWSESSAPSAGAPSSPRSTPTPPAAAP